MKITDEEKFNVIVSTILLIGLVSLMLISVESKKRHQVPPQLRDTVYTYTIRIDENDN